MQGDDESGRRRRTGKKTEDVPVRSNKVVGMAGVQRKKDGGATHCLIGPYKAGRQEWSRVLIFRVWRRLSNNQVAPSQEKTLLFFLGRGRMIKQISSDWS